jgi:hypothetical protein
VDCETPARRATSMLVTRVLAAGAIVECNHAREGGVDARQRRGAVSPCGLRAPSAAACARRPRAPSAAARAPARHPARDADAARRVLVV